MNDPERARLVVLFGGQSAEHDVSCVTAAHVLRAVDTARYDVVPVGITRDGTWVAAEEARAALADGRAELPIYADAPSAEPIGPNDRAEANEPAGDPALPEQLEAVGAELDPVVTVAPTDGQQVVVLPLLHGPNGEDGTVQGLLELADVPYVGCGVLASALCMDKTKAKEVLEVNGLPQAPWVTLRDLTDHPAAQAADKLVEDAGLRYPLFVKPANLGSSVGVSKVDERADLAAAVEVAAGYDEWIVIEQGVTGREIEVAVLGNTDPRASVPGEIVASHDFYDYEDKYLDGTSELRIPAPLSPEATAEIQELAVRSYSALRCDGMARVDFFYDEDGEGFVINELNTIPGFTPISMYPKLWEASGLAYGDLIDELIRLAVDRHTRRSRFSTKR